MAVEKSSLLKDIFLLVLGAALIAVGADLLVDNAIIIAKKLDVSEKVIGLTIVALGTSLPELVTAITSLAKGDVIADYFEEQYNLKVFYYLILLFVILMDNYLNLQKYLYHL